MSYVVSIRNDQVVVTYGLSDIETPISSVAELVAHVAQKHGANVYFSSSMDFPHDSTSDPKVLSLVAELQEACR
jgi:hypothetical protein